MGKREVGKKAVFIDRDGVINNVVFRDNKVCSPRSREEFIISGDASAAIKALKKRGYMVIIVTNQPDIARGLLSVTDLDWMTDKIMCITEVDDILVCPHDDSDNCTCRKPLPGMILSGAEKWGIDLSHSYLIGDGWKDIEAGNRAGCRCILIDREYNKAVRCNIHVSSLCAAAETIIDMSGD